MKVMYKYNPVAICTAVIIFNFSSCKYEDGPKISLRTKTARLTGNWNVKKSAGEKISANFELLMEFEKDGNFEISGSYSGYSYTKEGEWEWTDSKDAIKISIDGEPPEVLDILRLSNKELWMEDPEDKKWELEKI